MGWACRPPLAQSSAATATSSGWPTTAKCKPMCWATRPRTPRAPAISRGPGRTTAAWGRSTPGCPMGDDYLQGAVDPFGRVFAGDGKVHDGLYVTDGSVVPSALGVNPLMTISALTERMVERKIQQLGGNPYPQPAGLVSMATIDALDVIGYSEGQLEALFRRCPTMGIDSLVNTGGVPAIDTATQTIHNDRYWKGFFPKGHVLNAMSSAIFTGFRK